MGASAGDSAWVKLFNGKDLKDGDIKFTKHPLNTNFNNTFKVVDGILSVDYSVWGSFNQEFGHAANKTRPWSFYLLRVEYRVGEKQVNGDPARALQNNGLMLHSQSMASMTLNQGFPISLETQLLGASNVGADNNSPMNLCTPGTGFYTTETGGSVNNAHCYSANTATRPRPGACEATGVGALPDAFPENASLVREAGGFTFRSSEPGILEVTDPSGWIRFRKAVSAGVPQALRVPGKGLCLVTWRTAGAVSRIRRILL